MFSKIIVSNTISNLRNISEKYHVDENSFTCVKKLSPENVAGIIMNNTGCNINSEARNFIKRINNNLKDKVTDSAFCQRRQQLRSILFKDENDKLIHNVYKQLKHLHKYNGITLLAADTSIITLSNHTITKEKFGTKSKMDGNIIPRARISCITDTLTNIVLSSEKTVTQSSEPKLAVNQIDNLENIIDLSNTIIMGDRGYDSIEMILNIINYNSFFIIRLKESTFKKERKNLTGKDENIHINMNNSRLRNVDNQEVKEKFLKEGLLTLRIIKIPLNVNKNGNQEIEYLVTNLSKEIAPYEDFKELYNQRWGVETEFDRLKNIHQIENFSGRKEICIEQDFYAKILTYNLTMILKQDAERHMTHKISKDKKRRYQINTSSALSLFKFLFIDLLRESKHIKETILEDLIIEMAEDYSSSLIDPPTTERIIQDISNKFPGNIKRA